MGRKTRPRSRTAIALAATLGMTAPAGVALAEPQAEGLSAMPLGAAAPAPEGFIDLCRRSPEHCPALGPAPDLERLALDANRRRWAAVFGLAPSRSSGPSAAQTSATVLADASIVALVPRLIDVASPRVEASPADLGQVGAASAEDSAFAALEDEGSPLQVEAVAATDFASTAVAAPSPPDAPQSEPLPASLDGHTFALDRDGWRTVNRINRRLNREIRHVDDRDLHGQEDRWVLPTSGRGDCEDYVLAKRVALIEAGVPAEALSIAIVETPWGESHAVLLIASDRGEYVLDSLSPWVSRWDRVSYRWRERQARGGAFDWVSVDL